MGGVGFAPASLRRDVIAVTAARFLVPLLSSVLVIILARSSGPSTLGHYTFLITLFQLLEYLKSCGLQTLLVRECSGRPVELTMAWHSELIRFGVLGGIAVLPVLPLATAGMQPSAELIVGALLIGLGLLPSAVAMANEAALLAMNRSPFTVWLALGEGLLRTAVSVGVVASGGGLIALVTVYALCRALAAAAGWLLLSRIPVGPSCVDGAAIRAHLRREAVPFGKVFVLPLALFRLDVLMLGWFGTAAGIGIYGAAVRLFSIGLVLPDGVLGAVFATLSRVHAEQDAARLRSLVRASMQLLTSILVIAAACGSALALFGIDILFGPEFRDAADVLVVLLWSLPFFALNRALGDALVCTGSQRSVGAVVLAATASGCVIYPTGVIHAGAAGAAWALVAVTCLITTLTSVSAVRRQITTWSDVAAAGAPAVLGIVSAAFPEGRARNILLAASLSLLSITALLRYAPAFRPGIPALAKSGDCT